MHMLFVASTAGIFLAAPVLLAAEPCPQKTMVDAFMASQDLVRDGLMAPSTATFPIYLPDDEKTRVHHLSGCAFSIYSHVDAENVFGAMLRSRYAATMEYDVESDRWTGILLWVPAGL